MKTLIIIAIVALLAWFSYGSYLVNKDISDFEGI